MRVRMGKELAQYALHGTVTGVDECMGDVDITGGIRGIVRITWDKHTMDLIPKEKVMELSAEKQRTLTREIAEACIKEHGVVLQAVAVAETAALMGKDDHTSADELRENMTKSQDQKREQDIKREHDAALTLLERHDIAVMTSEEMNSLKLVQQNKGWSLLNALHIGNAETVELFEPQLSEEYVDAMEHITKHGIDLRADVPEKYTVEYKVCTCHIPFTAAKRGCSFQCTHFRRTTQNKREPVVHMLLFKCARGALACIEPRPSTPAAGCAIDEQTEAVRGPQHHNGGHGGGRLRGGGGHGDGIAK